MKIHVLFGQRKESYAGEYAPEALSCADQYGYEQNPDYLNGELDKYTKTNEFESLRIVELTVDDTALMQLLRPRSKPLPATIVG